MFTKDEILAQLREGTDAADIAQKMADEINAALDQYKAEQEAAKRDETRRADAREIVAGYEGTGRSCAGHRTEAERETAGLSKGAHHRCR